MLLLYIYDQYKSRFNWLVAVSILFNISWEHQASCSAKKLFYSGYFAGKIDPVLCVAGKRKYICWKTFLKNFLLNGIIAAKRRKLFLELWTIFANLLKLWGFFHEKHIIHYVMQLAGKNISAIFLGVKNTF